MIAEEALKLTPASTWASHAVLGFRCAKGDWSGALTILENNLPPARSTSGLPAPSRGAADGARARTRDARSRCLSRRSAMEAVKLAPTLVPAAVLASKFRASSIRSARPCAYRRRVAVPTPHPDLADAYAHVRLGDSAQQRLVRGGNAGRESARPCRRRARGGARRDRRSRIRPRARGAGAVAINADPAGRDADGGDRAQRAWRQRSRARLDPARGARARTIRRGPPTVMSAIAGDRCRRSPAGSMPSSGRRRSQRCRRTGAPRSMPRNSTRP